MDTSQDDRLSVDSPVLSWVPLPLEETYLASAHLYLPDQLGSGHGSTGRRLAPCTWGPLWFINSDALRNPEDKPAISEGPVFLSIPVLQVNRKHCWPTKGKALALSPRLCSGHWLTAVHIASPFHLRTALRPVSVSAWYFSDQGFWMYW